MRSGLRQQAGVLSLVLGCHLAALALTLAHSNEPVPEPEVVTPPTIVGIILPPPVAPPQPKPKPLPEPKPQPKQKPKPTPKPKPLPKAPPSEKAVSAPPVEPTPPPAKTAKAAKAAPAKAAPAAAIQPPSAEAQGLNNKAPLYPQLSRKKKEQGTVLLLILVKADGTVGEIQLKTSSGFTRLDQAAKQAVKRWQFQPALKDGKAIDFWYELPLNFRLNQG